MTQRHPLISKLCKPSRTGTMQITSTLIPKFTTIWTRPIEKLKVKKSNLATGKHWQIPSTAWPLTFASCSPLRTRWPASTPSTSTQPPGWKIQRRILQIIFILFRKFCKHFMVVLTYHRRLVNGMSCGTSIGSLPHIDVVEISNTSKKLCHNCSNCSHDPCVTHTNRIWTPSHKN